MAMKEISERENMQLVLDGKKPAWLPTYTEAFAIAGYQGALARKPDPVTGYNVDIFGVKFTQTIDGPIPVNTQTQDFELKDITKWKDVMPNINLASINWEDEAAAIKKTVKEGQMINFGAGTVWEQLHYMMGFEEALAALAEEVTAEEIARIAKGVECDAIYFLRGVRTT